jgi:Arc/MetJ family transcription regulator
MRTTIEIPSNLLSKVQDILQTSSKTETVTKALEEVIRSHQRKQLLTFKGKVDLNIDLDALRDRK